MVKSDNYLVLHNFQYFDGITNHLHRGKAIVIHGETIEAIESQADPGSYPGYEIIDMDGLTVLPGLIDNHVHITNTFMSRISIENIPVVDAQIEKNFQSCLEAGITTVRDVGSIPAKVQEYRKKADAGILPGPRIVTTNSALTNIDGCPEWSPWPPNLKLKKALGGLYTERPATPEEARNVVLEMIKKGADWIKTYYHTKSWMFHRKPLPVFDRATFQAIMDTSHEFGKKVCCHISWLEDLEFVLSMGVHSIEHSVLDEIPERYIDRMVKMEMALVPTLAVFSVADMEFWRRFEQFIVEKGDRFLEPIPLKQIKGMIEFFLAGGYPKTAEEAGDGPFFDIYMFQKQLPIARDNALRLLRAGGKVGVGTDAGGSPMAHFGMFYAEELKQMTAGGFSNFEILKAATSENAKIIDMENQIGTIEKGKLADLIVIDGNPLTDLGAIENIKMVFKGGGHPISL